MGPLVTCCILAFNLFAFNPVSASFEFTDKIFENSINFFESLFVTNPLPTKTEHKKSYTIALVGDSMTQFFGSADPLRDALKKHYPDREFGILNFGIGSTNILSVPERLEKESQRPGETLPPVLSTRPDIIFLESFGNNPLSHLPLKEGLQKQTEALDKVVEIIKEKHPSSVLVFVATVAPSKERYAEGVTNLMPDQRKAWAEERIAYIQNHIDYAKSHKIPLVNVFEKSLGENGDANIDYINTNDFIHPSVTGIQFISDNIADTVYQQKIIPN